MPRSRRYRKSQNQVKTEWGKNNPQTKAKNKKIMIAIGVIAVVAVVVSAVLVLGQSFLFSNPSPTSSPSPSPSPTPVASPGVEYSENGTKVVFMVTGTNLSGQQFAGNITIQMREDKPITTSNFVNLVRQGLYDGTLFHRVVSGFMIQGGQITSTTVSTIQDEIGNDNVNFNGSIAMANTGQANSGSSQFFINVADNSNLYSSFDTSYTVFGKVVSGMDVVMMISNVNTQPNPQMQNEDSQPTSPVTLVRAVVLP
jgi:cyclophilin family peptidyl-prolyl cis-trans isomerase